MGFQKHTPSFELSEVVDHFWILEINAHDLPFTHTILPYAWFELLFRLDDITTLESKYLGQFAKPITVVHNQPYRATGICLKPSAANLLFNIPANLTKNQQLNWNDLDQKSFLHEQLIDAQTDVEIIGLLENYVLSKIKNTSADSITSFLCSSIKNHLPYGNYNANLDNISLSRRRIEQRFLSSTGVSMSHFLKKVRFDEAVDRLCKDSRTSLTQIGLELGYYDQAHFTRDFKSFARFTPKDYRNNLLQMSSIERALQ